MRDGNSKKSKVQNYANTYFEFCLSLFFWAWPEIIDLFLFLFVLHPKLSWTKTLFKKWLNIKSKSEDFEADDSVYGGGILLFERKIAN